MTRWALRPIVMTHNHSALPRSIWCRRRRCRGYGDRVAAPICTADDGARIARPSRRSRFRQGASSAAHTLSGAASTGAHHPTASPRCARHLRASERGIWCPLAQLNELLLDTFQAWNSRSCEVAPRHQQARAIGYAYLARADRFEVAPGDDARCVVAVAGIAPRGHDETAAGCRGCLAAGGLTGGQARDVLRTPRPHRWSAP
jgi:hypothetical protein